MPKRTKFYTIQPLYRVLTPLLMKKIIHKMFYKDAYTFPAEVLRYAFAIYFILVAVKKFRMGIPEFATSITEGAMNTELLANEIPHILLYVYGLALPFVEFIAGFLLLINKYVREAYIMIALTYLSFIFGQMYSGNTSKIGTDYLPSLTALSIAVYAREKKGEK